MLYRIGFDARPDTKHNTTTQKKKMDRKKLFIKIILAEAYLLEACRLPASLVELGAVVLEELHAANP